MLADAAVSPDRVAGMAVSGQQHGLAPLDKAGRVIWPAKLWCDTETAPQAERLTERLGGTAAAITARGNAIAAGFTASKLVWLQEMEPAHYERLATVLLPHDYLNFWLTGERRAEYVDASGTAFFDVVRQQWSRPELKSVSCMKACRIASSRPSARIRVKTSAILGTRPACFACR